MPEQCDSIVAPGPQPDAESSTEKMINCFFGRIDTCRLSENYKKPGVIELISYEEMKVLGRLEKAHVEV